MFPPPVAAIAMPLTIPDLFRVFLGKTFREFRLLFISVYHFGHGMFKAIVHVKLLSKDVWLVLIGMYRY